MCYYFLYFLAFGAYLANGLYVVNTGPQYPPTKGEVWPKPQFERKENYYYNFNPTKLQINITGSTCDILKNAIDRYSFIIRRTYSLNGPRHKLLRRKHKRMSTVTQYDDNKLGILHELDIDLQSPCQDYPYFGMDESYDLTVAAKSKLSSNSIWGILRGLETWSQLFYFSSDYVEILINKTHIVDFPRYSHRGLLLDTSRHFISLTNILKTLDAMSMNKFNVFHWHIVDDQSFPYQSSVFPALSFLGAFDQTLIYTKADIQLVINYARDRGIRVIPEFDVPGHTRSWGNAYPETLTKCYINDQEVGLGPMNPTHNDTYRILKDLFNEVQQLFPDKYFHVGGDEVDLDCWKSNPELQKYMKDHGITAAQLHGLFMQNVLPLLGNKSTPIVWQEVFDEGVPLSDDTLLQVWKQNWVDEMVKIIRIGRSLIFSSSWYLDRLLSGGDWVDFYLADPREMVAEKVGNDPILLNKIVGGEACMWGEVVDDTNVISRVWPRASAVAERLWSASMDNFKSSSPGFRHLAPELDEVKKRIEEHACRMRRRGIHAQPPNGPGYCVGGF